MENDTQDVLTNIVKSYYTNGVSYSETMDIIKRTFLLSREDRLLCKEIWRGCMNGEKQND